ncbi:MAG TPA: CsgG/HfaB family protein [Candidatus Sulfopaludibacter sp.]|nr:CsgG/HfaB family protein [Candidatus Sulfopaludibacter sp.]
MKAILSIILNLSVAILVAHAAPQPPITVAVYDLSGEGDAESYGNKVTALVTADLTAETNLVMVERAELNKALREQAFGVSGIVSSDAAAKIGQITGAKVLVVGQVIKTGENHLVIVAEIIGTETARLFAPTVDGPADNLLELTSELSAKIARTISDQATNLVMPPEESHEARLERIIKSIHSTNRPNVSVYILQYNRYGTRWPDVVAENEFGALLLKAGFEVVDNNSDQKPDIEIIGEAVTSWGEASPARGGLLSINASVEVKIQEKKTGKIIAFDRQESAAIGAGETVVDQTAQVNAVDALAERVLPLLAK